MPNKLEVEYISIDDIKTYPNNAKLHPAEQIEQIKKSIQEFGFNDPIAIDEKGVIIEGHGRYIACTELGIKEVPIIRLNELTDEQKRAYMLVHNKLTMNSDFDLEILMDELDNISFDMSDYGFDMEIEEPEQEIEEVDTPEPPKEPKSKLGDIYQLGNHRLMCGDSTDKDQVLNLLGGERADIMFTSPPYNTQQGENFEVRGNQKGKSGNYYGDSTQSVYNEYQDNLSDEEYANLLIKVTENALEYCDDVMLDIGILKGSKNGIIDLLTYYKNKFLDILIWNKSSSFPIAFKSQLGAVSHRCELIFCFNQNGNRKFTHPQWKPGTQINRIDTPNASGNEYAKEHGATFPVELPYNIIKDYTDTSCLDLFGGTGTTLIACEQLDRKCYCMELDPHYVDVIIQRWENFTGQKAVKIC